MSAAGRIAQQWESYVWDVMPADASAVQFQETRRAFYAGAVALQSVLLAGVSAGDRVEDADVELMESIDRELEAFWRSVKEGQA